MVKLLALVMFVIASAEYVFDGTGPFGRFGPAAFVTFGLTLWCLSSLWDHSYSRSKPQP